jgi:hypothetical protein
MNRPESLSIPKPGPRPEAVRNPPLTFASARRKPVPDSINPGRPAPVEFNGIAHGRSKN